jgi:hypothetical protein
LRLTHWATRESGATWQAPTPQPQLPWSHGGGILVQVAASNSLQDPGSTPKIRPTASGGPLESGRRRAPSQPPSMQALNSQACICTGRHSTPSQQASTQESPKKKTQTHAGRMVVMEWCRHMPDTPNTRNRACTRWPEALPHQACTWAVVQRTKNHAHAGRRDMHKQNSPPQPLQPQEASKRTSPAGGAHTELAPSSLRRLLVTPGSPPVCHTHAPHPSNDKHPITQWWPKALPHTKRAHERSCKKQKP